MRYCELPAAGTFLTTGVGRSTVRETTWSASFASVSRQLSNYARRIDGRLLMQWKTGQTFREWWLNEYMISNQTLLHKNPKTGDPQPIGLGWLDDAMTMTGPTESDPNYVNDTLGNRTNRSVSACSDMHNSKLLCPPMIGRRSCARMCSLLTQCAHIQSSTIC